MRNKTFLILLFVPVLSFAQFKNIKLDEVDASHTVCEPAIAINKKKPNNIIAASLLGNIYYTTDAGTTWQTVKVTSSAGVSRNPVLVSDDKGNIYTFHLSGTTGEGATTEKNLDQILCHISKDGGNSWEEGAPLGMNAPKDQQKPWATVDSKGNIWVAWTQFDQYKSEDANCQSNILLSNSSNGKKWSRPVQISQTPGDCKDDDGTALGAMPAIGVDGKAFVAWSNQSKIFLDRSFDGGGIWLTNDIAIAALSGGSKLKIPGHGELNSTPVFMVDQSKTNYRGSLYATWADQRSGDTNTDVWFSRSTNYGDNWSTPLKLGDDKNNRHQFMPWMTVDEATGYIYAVFYDRSEYEDNQTDVRLAYSTDGGITFKTVKISETPFTPDETNTIGDYNNISAHRGIITPVWTRMENGKTSIWTAVIKQSDLIQAPQALVKKKKK